MTDTEIQERDDAIGEALVAGRSVRSVQKQFGLSAPDLDAVLERLWPIDTQSRLRMIKSDLAILTKLTQVFFEKALAGCTQSGLVAIRVLERKHELLGMNSAAKIEIVQAPPEQPSDYERIRAAVYAVARPNGRLPSGDGNGPSRPESVAFG